MRGLKRSIGVRTRHDQRLRSHHGCARTREKFDGIDRDNRGRAMGLHRRGTRGVHTEDGGRKGDRDASQDCEGPADPSLTLTSTGFTKEQFNRGIPWTCLVI